MKDVRVDEECQRLISQHNKIYISIKFILLESQQPICHTTVMFYVYFILILLLFFQQSSGNFLANFIYSSHKFTPTVIINMPCRFINKLAHWINNSCNTHTHTQKPSFRQNNKNCYTLKHNYKQLSNKQKGGKSSCNKNWISYSNKKKQSISLDCSPASLGTDYVHTLTHS